MATTYDEVVPETQAPTGHRRRASPSADREGPTRQRSPLGGLGRAALTGGLLVAAIGIVEMVAWHLHWTDVLRIRDSYTPMVYNTAFALAVTGAAIASSVRGTYRWLRVAGVLDVTLGVVVLAQHALGWDLRVDELFVRAYLVASTDQPGRMPVNAAVSFVATGTALLIWRPDARRWRCEAPTAAATVVASIAVTALSGYLAGLPVAHGWLSLIAMPWPTALSMTLVAASLLALAFATREQRSAPLSGWIAVPAGAAACVVTALVWQVSIDMGSPASISRSEASRTVLFLALLTGGLLALTTWLAQHANRRRRTAEALTARLSEEVARAHVTSDDLPPISGDAGQLGQLFQNLISNAIKFTATDGEPRIHLGCQHRHDHWRFTVTDNGIGIDAHHRERIFGMFKRLHTRDAYPGTGIGLAVCKKIVERHRGTIGVADGPHGHGSTFWFTLRQQQEKRA